MRPMRSQKRNTDLRNVYGTGDHQRSGKRGGKAVKATRTNARTSVQTKFDRQHYMRIGEKGGDVTKQRGSDYYRRIGKQGRDARARNKENAIGRIDSP